jgi:tetratricopeptide (TPR) repeat protein
MCSSHRRLVALLACATLSIGALAQQNKSAPGDDCPSDYDYSISVDYRDSKWQTKIRNIEFIHFNTDVENLVRGQTMAAPGGDIEFLLRYVPNHHRALYSLVKLGLRDKTEMPYQTKPYTVICWLQRASTFSPDDGKVYLISGIYLSRLGRHQDALNALRDADRLIPEDENVQYNLGLVYFDLKDYDHSLEHAKRAYKLGFPLPGLKRKLQQVGQWRE